MSAQGNINVSRTYWDALQHPGPVALQTKMELMDEHIAWEVVPLGLKRRGRKEMRQLIEGSWADAPGDGWHEITNVFASDDWVCLECTARGTMTKALPHLNITYRPTGQQMEIRAVDVFHMKNGKIASAREYYDQATLMRKRRSYQQRRDQITGRAKEPNRTHINRGDQCD